MIISKQIEWDMGHRVMNHKSKCRNLHGHRYKMEICLEGEIITQANASNEGMVVDFGDIKDLAMKQVHDVLDHGFMVWDKDEILVSFFKKNKELKHLIVPFTSTAENIAAWIFKLLDEQFRDIYGNDLRLSAIKLWETPTSLAVFSRSDMK